MSNKVLSFSTAANDTSVGYAEYNDPAWQNPANALIDDGSKAAVSLDSETESNYLKVTGPTGDPVPSGATITGVEIKAKVTNTGPQGQLDFAQYAFQRAHVVIGGVAVGANLAEGDQLAQQGGTAERTFGGPSNLAGLTLTPAIVNSSGFGVAVQCWGQSGVIVGIDKLWAVVHYAE